MIKAAGIFLLIITTSLAGIAFSKRLTERVKLLAQIRLMLEELSIQIRYQSSTVAELLESLRQNPQLAQLSFFDTVQKNLCAGQPFADAWCTGVAHFSEISLQKEDTLLLKSIGLSLGTSDVEGQLSTLELHKSTVGQLLERAIAERDKKTKLYRSLGVLTGVFLSILFL